MIANLLQAIGAVLTLMVITAAVIASMYISYVLGIAAVIVTLVFITYHILSTLKSHK